MRDRSNGNDRRDVNSVGRYVPCAGGKRESGLCTYSKAGVSFLFLGGLITYYCDLSI